MKKFFLMIFCFAAATLSIAQGSYTGSIVSQTDQKPLYLATVTVYKASDTSIITYKLSNEKGVFRLTGIPLHLPCRAVITYSGYKVFRQEFMLTDSSKEFNAGTISLGYDSAMLDEVLVISERPPMMVKNDTIEFNASSFKMLPNAVVEDLLKKLPGVSVDNDGNISVAGKRVNRILVDGKTFFGEDPKMASRNLPSFVIDKVQVTDDKEEMLRNGDDNLQNVGKVINLTFKKGMKKGVFGKAYGGGGGGLHGGRFEAGAIANFFRDTMQLSVLGYTNNLNRPGFSVSDILQTGGMGRASNVTGTQSTSVSSSAYGSGITINGINFGGMSNRGGVSTSNGLGLNFNHAPSKKQSIYAQYFFGNVKTDLNQRRLSQITHTDSIISNNTAADGTIINNAHNLSAGISLKPDSLTTFFANATYILGLQNNNTITLTDAFSNLAGVLNKGNTRLINKVNNQQFMQRASYTRLARNKKGRQFTITNNVAWSNNLNDAFTTGNIQYYQPNNYDSTLSQYRSERVPSLTNTVAANYSEPIANNWKLRFNTFYKYEKLTNHTATFGGTDFAIPNAALTNRFERHSNSFSGSAGLEYKYKSLTITPGIRYQFQHFQNSLSDLPQPLIQKIGKILPQMNIRFKDINIDYRRDIVLPSYRYLIPVVNNTNPYMVELGNPNLLPAVKDEVSVNYYKYFVKQSLNIWGWASYSATDNDVIQNLSLSESGIQTTMPVNASGTKQAVANFGVSKQYKSSQKFSISWNVGNYSNFRQNPYTFNNITSRQKNLAISGWGGFGLNWNDVLEWNNSFGISYTHLANTNRMFTNFHSMGNSVGTEFVVRWPKHVIFETKANYGNNGRAVEAAYRKYFLWNVAVNFTMFKDERGVLKLALSDLLNQSRNVNINSNQNMVSTNYNNIIGQYFMATFTYNIRQAGANKKVGGTMWWF